ncbi:MAG: valine--tRNA ligase [Pseudomonadota bacterium]|nr:valine--tRNA ligase [Pseudomonadota bacterium]
MNKNFDPSEIETKWYKFWEESGFFEAKPESNKDTFCIMIPPPNVTGTLHMGHGFQNALIDTLIRFKRMNGYDALWQVGTDHAGIATQMVVERQLESEGITKEDLGREEFIKRVWDWKESSGNTITKQIRRLGSSVDWSREAFTMSPDMSQAVLEVFIKLYKEGLIYQGERLVNWDVELQTTLSDLEVDNREENGSLWHLKYQITNESKYLIVATTRPETMLGDTAVAVNPEDDRYKKYIGKSITLPITNRQVPIIADEYVDEEFGTGCVKITPAHDFNDFEIGKRHGLEIINILNKDGTLNEEVPKSFIGLDRSSARKKVLSELEKLNLLEKTEPYKVTIPRGDRSGSILEPLLTKQWFMDVNEISKKAIDVVKSEESTFHPKNYENTYFAWMNEIRDWCISRQLWWGHQIPAWYDKDGKVYVGSSEEEIRKENNLDEQVKLKRDEDVLDTWFSSALWTFSTLGWPKSRKLLDRYHPTDVLVTGYDIISLWVSRMLMMTTHFINEVPFRKIFVHGLINDSSGQKMSKSKGNIIDPLDIIDGIDLKSLIEKRISGLMQPKMEEKIKNQTIKEFPEGIKPYGTDALRLTFCSLASGSREVRFDFKRVEGYRNFCNKLWNASRFIQMQLDNFQNFERTKPSGILDDWINARMDIAIEKTNNALSDYRFDLATQSIYEFIWYELCDWYIEFCKINLNSQSLEASEKNLLLNSMIEILEKTLRLSHPFMPFITEEIWQNFKDLHQSKNESVAISSFPQKKEKSGSKNADDIEWVKQFISGVRNIKGEMKISPSKKITSLIQSANEEDKRKIKKHKELLFELLKIKELNFIDEKNSPPSAIFTLGGTKILIPLEGLIEPDKEITRIDKLINKLQTELNSITSKLNNDNFIENAPQELVNQQRDRSNYLSNEINNLEIQHKEITKLI